MQTKKIPEPQMDERLFLKQKGHWEEKLTNIPDMFGPDPSRTAIRAINIFRREGLKNIVELGCGQGRDTLFFARNGFKVQSLDYSEGGVRIVSERARALGLAGRIHVIQHDLRKPLPFNENSFDACYAHMVYCMAFTTLELEFISAEVQRVLKPGGFIVYTVRNKEDPHYGKGIYRGGDIYEMNGFVVHYFDKNRIRQLAKGFKIVRIERCEESSLPRRLFRVIMKKIG